MIDARIEELMWLEIDETISPSDREILNAHLQTHPGAREHFAELRRMALLFGQVGEIDPPPELHGRILRALETATPPRARRAGVLDRLGALFTPRPAWKLAAAAAAGAFIGVLGYHLIRTGLGNSGPLDNTQFYGTMNVESVGHNGPVVHIDVPDATGALTVRRDDSRVFSELEVSSEKEIEVALVYGGTPLKFAVGKLSDHPSNQVAVQNGEVRVRNQGRGTYQFLFALDKNPESPVVVRVMSQGSVLYEKKIFPTRATTRTTGKR
jgi:hypothetical protein